MINRYKATMQMGDGSTKEFITDTQGMETLRKIQRGETIGNTEQINTYEEHIPYKRSDFLNVEGNLYEVTFRMYGTERIVVTDEQGKRILEKTEEGNNIRNYIEDDGYKEFVDKVMPDKAENKPGVMEDDTKCIDMSNKFKEWITKQNRHEYLSDLHNDFDIVLLEMY